MKNPLVRIDITLLTIMVIYVLIVIIPAYYFVFTSSIEHQTPHAIYGYMDSNGEITWLSVAATFITGVAQLTIPLSIIIAVNAYQQLKTQVRFSVYRLLFIFVCIFMYIGTFNTVYQFIDWMN